MNIEMVYITAGSREEARTIGKELVVSGLAACVNILDNMNSMYVWEGVFQDDTEAVLIAKTTTERVTQLIEKVKTLHSYDCPCIVSFPVLRGNSRFMKWVARQVGSAQI